MRSPARVVLLATAFVLWIDGLLAWSGDMGPVGWLLSIAIPQLFALPPLIAGFFALRRKAWGWAMAGGAAVGFQIFGPMGLCVGHPRAGRPDLRVMSYNVELYLEGPEHVAATIRKAAPDVFCLQEASFGADLKPPHRFMAMLPGYHYFTEGGMVIASKRPFQKAEVTTFPSHLFPTNWNIQEARIQVADRTIRVINVHMVPDVYEPPQWPAAHGIFERVERKRRLREEELDEAIRRIDADDGPLIVCGDFNDQPFGPHHRRLESRLEDSYAATNVGFGYTLLAKIPTKRVDYIWTRHIRPLRTRVPSSEASDHLPVVAELAF